MVFGFLWRLKTKYFGYTESNSTSKAWNLYGLYLKEYQEGQKRCLFYDWDLENKGEFTIRGKVNINGIDLETIEDLIKYQLILTETAIKKIGLWEILN